MARAMRATDVNEFGAIIRELGDGGCESFLMFLVMFVFPRLEVNIEDRPGHCPMAWIGLRSAVSAAGLPQSRPEAAIGPPATGRRPNRADVRSAAHLDKQLTQQVAAGQNREMILERTIARLQLIATACEARRIGIQKVIGTHVCIFSPRESRPGLSAYANLLRLVEHISSFVQDAFDRRPEPDSVFSFVGIKWPDNLKPMLTLLFRSKATMNAGHQLLGLPLPRTFREWRQAILAKCGFTEKPWEMCRENLFASLRLFAPKWPKGTKVRLVVDATALTRCLAVSDEDVKRHVGDLSPDPPTAEQVAKALEDENQFLAYAASRELAGAAHTVLIVSTEHIEVVPFCVIRAVNGARTAAVNAELVRARALIIDCGFDMEAIVTDGDRNGIRQDLRQPCQEMVSFLRRIGEVRTLKMTFDSPAHEVMNAAKGQGLWGHLYDLFHALNNLRTALAESRGGDEYLLMWPPKRVLDDRKGVARTEREWDLGPPQEKAKVDVNVLRRFGGIPGIYFKTSAYDGMDQAKTLALFGGFYFQTLLQELSQGKIGGAYVLLWTIAYLPVSVRTLHLGREESIRRLTWLWALTTLLADAWQGSVHRTGGKWRGNPVFSRDLLYKLMQIAALRVTEANENKVMNLEAGDTRRLEHLFAEIKKIAPDHGVAGFLNACPGSYQKNNSRFMDRPVGLWDLLVGFRVWVGFHSQSEIISVYAPSKS
jgi:hypothetical protein